METFDEVLARWADAEARGDTAMLDGLLAPEFRGDGPAGFVLGKRQWLERESGSFRWTVSSTRVRHGTGVGTGRASRDGQTFACTVVGVRRGGWVIVNVQLGKDS